MFDGSLRSTDTKVAVPMGYDQGRRLFRYMASRGRQNLALATESQHLWRIHKKTSYP